MQDSFARARDDRVSCIQYKAALTTCLPGNTCSERGFMLYFRRIVLL